MSSQGSLKVEERGDMGRSQPAVANFKDRRSHKAKRLAKASLGAVSGQLWEGTHSAGTLILAR